MWGQPPSAVRSSNARLLTMKTRMKSRYINQRNTISSELSEHKV
jgi:hypothetical protein